MFIIGRIGYKPPKKKGVWGVGGGLRLPTNHASYTPLKWEFVHWFQPFIAKRDTYQDHGGKNDFSPHMAAKICDFGGITSSID